MLTHTWGGCVIQICQNKNLRIENCDLGMWMTSSSESARGGFWRFWKKISYLSLAVRRGRVTFTSSQWPCGGCHTCWGCRWKSQHRKIVPLSPYVEEPLNSKVIKSFVPELRSCKCFLCFGIPMFYVYMLRTFYVRFTYTYLAMLHIDSTQYVPLKYIDKKLYNKIMLLRMA